MHTKDDSETRVISRKLMLLLLIIYRHANEENICTLSNQELSEKLGRDLETIKSQLRRLRKLGLIKTRRYRDKNGINGLKRIIELGAK